MVANSKTNEQVDPVEVSSEVYKKIEMILFKNKARQED